MLTKMHWRFLLMILAVVSASLIGVPSAVRAAMPVEVSATEAEEKVEPTQPALVDLANAPRADIAKPNQPLQHNPEIGEQREGIVKSLNSLQNSPSAGTDTSKPLTRTRGPEVISQIKDIDLPSGNELLAEGTRDVEPIQSASTHASTSASAEAGIQNNRTNSTDPIPPAILRTGTTGAFLADGEMGGLGNGGSREYKISPPPHLPTTPSRKSLDYDRVQYKYQASNFTGDVSDRKFTFRKDYAITPESLRLNLPVMTADFSSGSYPVDVKGNSPISPSPNKPPIQERISTRAADLLPTLQDSAPANNPNPFQEYAANLDQTGGQLNVSFGSPNKPFVVGFGDVFPDPTALQGATRQRVVSTVDRTRSQISITPYLRQRLGANQFALLQLLADTRRLGFDLGYTIAPSSLPGVFSVNFFNVRGRVPVFEYGDREVNLIHGNRPWLHRLGGGIEYLQPLTPRLSAAAGISYQRVSVRNAAFSSTIRRVDELGNPVTFSNTGQDDLLTLNFAALYSTLDNRQYPTRGSKVRFGVDQSFPVGSGNILFTRFMGNFTQFIPLNLFGFSNGPRTFVLNFQAGTTIGDLPPYEAFTLGGSESVRGFNNGEVAAGRSFIQTTAEYRFPITSLSLFRNSIDLRGVLFVDYGTDLGSGKTVTGRPGVVRNKPGDGLGYGVGLHARTSFGLLRIEYGRNDRGGDQVHFEIGDRF